MMADVFLGVLAAFTLVFGGFSYSARRRRKAECAANGHQWMTYNGVQYLTCAHCHTTPRRK